VNLDGFTTGQLAEVGVAASVGRLGMADAAPRALDSGLGKDSCGVSFLPIKSRMCATSSNGRGQDFSFIARRRSSERSSKKCFKLRRFNGSEIKDIIQEQRIAGTEKRINAIVPAIEVKCRIADIIIF
jgi:hypothetical protein